MRSTMTGSQRSSRGIGAPEMVLDVALWPTVLLPLAIFGLLPGPLLRLVVQLYPKGDPRRRELLGELYAIEFHKRPFFLAQCLELALLEGLPTRWRRHHAGTTLKAPVSLAASGFRDPTACWVVGITPRQLDYWVRTDLIRPFSDVTAEGAPHRRFSYIDLLELKLGKHLLDAGVPMRAVRKTIQYLREQGGDLSTAHQVLTRSGSVLCRNGDEVLELLGRRPGLLTIVSLADIKSEVDAAILALRPASSVGTRFFYRSEAALAALATRMWGRFR